MPILKVNAHIHTPYSFSAFSSIKEAVDLAKKENIKVLGINDFFSADGYEDFYNACISNKIYPLFNIEFIGLIKEFQSKGIRINDPNNPGRIYFSGKGLKYPFNLSEKYLQKILKLQDESNNISREMILKANTFFTTNSIDIKLDFDLLKSKYAKKLLRERHIAKAIRIEITEKYKDPEERKSILRKLYSGKESLIDINNYSALENEIRNNLLKSGGTAFVPEDENAFLNINEIIEIIINAGGIPCYPVLLDDSKGNFTDFEKDWDQLHIELSKLNVKCIEIIPVRNNFEILEKFTKFFNDRNYIISYGTEHNTPELIPLTVSCRNNIPLTEELEKISFEGACVIAAHQYFISKGEKGYLNSEQKKEFIKIGENLINEIVK